MCNSESVLKIIAAAHACDYTRQSTQELTNTLAFPLNSPKQSLYFPLQPRQMISTAGGICIVPVDRTEKPRCSQVPFLDNSCIGNANSTAVRLCTAS